MLSLFNDLSNGKTLITVNNRLARTIQGRYDEWQAEQGKEIWPSATILPWSAWLKLQYEYLLDCNFLNHSLLNSTQERIVWEQVIRRSEVGKKLLRPVAAAKSAQQAYLLFSEWRLNVNQLTDSDDESQLFAQWINAFQSYCQQKQWLSQAELIAQVTNAIEQQVLSFSNDIILAGFDDHSPARKHLWITLEQTISVSQAERETKQCKTQSISSSDPDTEMLLAAHWAKQTIKQSPNKKIAIVSPRLEQQRTAIDRTFTEVLHPEKLLGIEDVAKPLFNISMGRSLSDYAMINDAMLALRLCQRALPLNDIGRFLRSPFLANGQSQHIQQSQLDVLLRKTGYPKVDRRYLLKRALGITEESGSYCYGLRDALTAAELVINDLPKDASPTDWSGHFLALLKALNWPGDGKLDSHEYQLAEKFRQTISEFSLLSQVQHRMTFSQALSRLQQLCDESVFQAQAAANTPIQVLGILEAGGLDFDAIWLLSMDDQQWPPSPSPNPLLPANLQRELEMPHASAERELTFAQQLTAHLLSSAPEVTASYSEQADNKTLNISPLLKHWASTSIEQLQLTQLDDVLRQSCSKTENTDDLPLAKAPPAPESPRGGAHLLSAQSACPFQAVARYRLQAEPLAEAVSAPDGAMLGNLVHEILFDVWRTLNSSQALADIEYEKLITLIEKVIDNHLAEFSHQRPDLFGPTFVLLEKERLKNLILAWLDLEKQRDLAFEIDSLEAQQIINLNGLKLTMRADRIDRLEDGTLAVIDYKTSATVNTQGWLTERISEPQVPLYCIDSDKAVSAALIAKVRKDKTEFKGLANQTGIAPKIKAFDGSELVEEWDDLIVHWRYQINMLAEEIKQGRADITPNKSTCQFCQLSGLCRLNDPQEQAHA